MQAWIHSIPGYQSALSANHMKSLELNSGQGKESAPSHRTDTPVGGNSNNQYIKKISNPSRRSEEDDTQ